MRRDAHAIAQMLLSPGAPVAFVAEKVADEWESAVEEKSLAQCLDEVMDIYAQQIQGELGFDLARRTLALEVEISRRIKPKDA